MKEEFKEDASVESGDYLSRLSFNPRSFGKFSWGYFNNIRIVVLFMAILILGGIFSFISVPRNLMPEVEIPIIFVSTVLPGASSEDVESLLSIPIEDKLKGLDGIDTVFSTSTEGVSGVTVQFDSDVDLDKAESDVQTAVNSITSLPGDATDPAVASLDFENQPIWTFSVTSNIDDVSLNIFSQELKNELEDLARIDRASTSGIEQQEVQMTVDPEVLKATGVNIVSLSQSIQNAISSHPAGVVNSSSSSFTISLDPTVTSIEKLRELSVNINGKRYILSEIASISERPLPGQSNAYLINGNSGIKKAVTFNIYRNLNERIDKSYEEAEELVNQKIKTQDGRFSIKTVYSTAEEMDKQFNSLFRNFSITIGLVFIVLLLFFGIRQAFIASIAIPFSFLFSFITMQVADISLSFLSMFSLLISLGLLVDVTIVIVSAITSYYESGKFSPIEAGLLVWKDFRITLLITTITTVWAFSPLLLSTGIIGEFIRPIPIIVSATLIGSLVVGLFITLPLMIVFLKPTFPQRLKIMSGFIFMILLLGITAFVFNGNPLILLIIILVFILTLVCYTARKEIMNRFNWLLGGGLMNKIFKTLKSGAINFHGVRNYYRGIIEGILNSRVARKKTLIAVIIFSIFSFALVPTGFVVNEFFPKENMDFLYVGVELPKKTRLDVTKKEAFDLAKDLRNTSGLDSLQIQFGAKIAPDGNIAESSDSDTILFTLVLAPEKERELDSIEIAESLREKSKDYNKGKISVVELSGGPPAGADVAIKILGEDLDKLDSYADDIMKYLRGDSGVTNVTKSIDSGAAKVVAMPNEEKLSELGISNSEFGLALRTFTNGFEMDSDINFSDLSEDRDIVLRMDQGVQDISSLGRAYLRDGVSVLAVSDFKLMPNPNKITREDSKRTISVSASVRDGYSAGIINKELEKFANSLNLPTGYSWKTGGANEENEESVQSILKAMLLAFVLILITLVVQLGSYRKAIIVMFVIPLALSGVFIIFAIFGIPLSFPALIGVLALFGIVVNNSIILVDKINLNLKSKMNLMDSIADASSSRLEPIALGSLTTIIGLIPITLSDPLWQGLGGAIIAGLVFSGTIMLFFIPVVYYAWFKEKDERQAI